MREDKTRININLPEDLLEFVDDKVIELRATPPLSGHRYKHKGVSRASVLIAAVALWKEAEEQLVR
jgi:hypothetical protein